MNDEWQVRDWYVALQVGGSVCALITLAFFHPAEAAMSVCGAVPVILGLYHWLLIRDQKIPDAT
jgi:sugar phosphate permease